MIDPANRRSGLKPQSQLVHAGTTRSQAEETAEAITMTSGFVYQTAEEAESAFVNEGTRYVYSRFRNPTIAMFEERLAAFEGAPRCFGLATGMSAVFASLAADIKVGDRIVAPHAMFGSCTHIIKNILPNYGVTYTMVEGTSSNSTFIITNDGVVVFDHYMPQSEQTFAAIRKLTNKPVKYLFSSHSAIDHSSGAWWA